MNEKGFSKIKQALVFTLPEADMLNMEPNEEFDYFEVEDIYKERESYNNLLNEIANEIYDYHPELWLHLMKEIKKNNDWLIIRKVE